MKYKTIKGLIFVVFAAVGFNVQAIDALSYNPFEQPDMMTDASGSKSNKTLIAEMKLRGTVMDGADSLVNISGKFYRVNEAVGDYRVIEINSSSVTLQRAGNEMVLTLNDE